MKINKTSLRSVVCGKLVSQPFHIISPSSGGSVEKTRYKMIWDEFAVNYTNTIWFASVIHVYWASDTAVWCLRYMKMLKSLECKIHVFEDFPIVSVVLFDIYILIPMNVSSVDVQIQGKSSIICVAVARWKNKRVVGQCYRHFLENSFFFPSLLICSV